MENGVIVPESSENLPDGALVEIRLVTSFGSVVEAPEEWEDTWRREGEDSWATITWGQF